MAVKPLLAETGTTLVFTDEIVLIGDRYYVKATAELKVRGATLDKTFAYAREADWASGQAPPQCTGSASSYARKDCANALFCIDDTKDADSQKRPASTAATTQPDTTVPPPITITSHTTSPTYGQRSATCC